MGTGIQVHMVRRFCLGIPVVCHIRGKDMEFTPEAVTDLPIQVGGRLDIEGPWRLRLSTTLGVLPGAYVDLINAVMVAADAYDQDTADLIRAALKNSLIWRIHLGWRPFANYGFYFEVGYGLAALGGGLGGEQLISVATGVKPPSMGPANRQYHINSILHMIDVEIGWRWLLWRGLSLRAAIGFAGTLDAHTTVTPDYNPMPMAKQAEAAFCAKSAAYLDDIYTSYVFAPVVSVGLGWRF